MILNQNFRLMSCVMVEKLTFNLKINKKITMECAVYRYTRINVNVENLIHISLLWDFKGWRPKYYLTEGEVAIGPQIEEISGIDDVDKVHEFVIGLNLAFCPEYMN